MTLTRIVLRLARNPGFPDGDRSQGYVITAPLDADGRLDLAAWRDDKRKCSVVRFSADEERHADGLLTHRGGHWYIHYDEEREGDDEPLYRLGDHKLAVGDYVTIHAADGDDLTYRVDQHQRAP